ncbi:MAG TPA: protein kinase [Bryobacteraceae bacterium]|nr:protein kinase [Bryobacteraceae bacterium]
MDPKLFGRYQIVRKLAGGGMGRVFLAYDPVLNRQVGLKLIDAGGDRDSLDVIAAERRGATLQDQLAKREASGRVAQIFDVGEREGYFYIAMEYIEGEDLSELMARGPMPSDRAVGIALDILDVLVKAHSFQTVIEDRPHRGIIHGDIKPRNIRMTSGGQVKVLDFGIAKAVSMTRSITFNQFGSIPYSSPERLQTGDMDARSDVWSVAIVLFEMLTAKSYFEAEASSKLEWMIRNYRALQPAMVGIQPGLREVLSRALDPDISRRFPSAAAFEAALHEWQRYGVPGPAASTDLDATRRTAYPNPLENTRRAVAVVHQAPRKMARPPVAPASIRRINGFALRLPATLARGVIVSLVALFLVTVFVSVFEIRMMANARALSSELKSGKINVDQGAAAYKALLEKSFFATPLYPARNTLRERYVAEADDILADYREASESTPFNFQDWQRAAGALNAALAIAPDDKQVHGRARLVDGFLKLLPRRNGKKRIDPDYRTARADFEAARTLLPQSPDPHLGLAQIYMHDNDLEDAQHELDESKRNGFIPRRRELRALADTFKRRGEKWVVLGQHARDIGQMKVALQHAEEDLGHAKNLYDQIAPNFNGAEMADKVSMERDDAAKSLAAAQTATSDPSTP